MNLHKHFKAKLAIGIATIIPLFILFHFFLFLYGLITKFIGLEWITTINNLFFMTPADIARHLISIVLTLIIALGSLLFLGYLASNKSGKRMLNWFWSKMSSFPVVGRFVFPIRESVKRAYTDYLNVDDVFEAIVLLKSDDFREIGFLTGKTHLINGEKVYSVFIPGAPIPTTGKLVFVTEDQFELIDMETTDAVNTILTLGVTNINTAKKEKKQQQG